MILQLLQEINLRNKQLPEEYLQYIPKQKPIEVNYNNLTRDTYQEIDKYIKTKTLHSCLHTKLRTTKYSEGSPIVLVFCQPGDELKEDYPYVPVSYCSWLESAGARCIPVSWNLTENTMQHLVKHSNGLVVPGGNSNLYKVYKTKQGVGNVTAGFKKLWKFITKQWDKGIHYPVWGTCLGFQLILLMLSGDMKILNSLNSKNHTLDIFSFYEQSTILKQLPLQMKVNVENKKLLNFTHVNGLSMKRFLFDQNCQSLRKQLKLISGARDKDGQWFCAFLQGRSYPIYISQFHPQKQSYQWNLNAVINHNYEAIQLSQYLGNQFVEECRKNSNSFPTKQQSHSLLINNFIPRFDIECKYSQVYFIDFKFKKKVEGKSQLSTRPKIQSSIKPKTAK